MDRRVGDGASARASEDFHSRFMAPGFGTGIDCDRFEIRSGFGARAHVRGGIARRNRGGIAGVARESRFGVQAERPVCRYSGLGFKPSSTSVHLWIFEQKSGTPW
jgi:hypothetical protein